MAETGSHSAFSHPAIFAGLMGSAAWGGAPTVALASPVQNMVEVVSNSLVLQFVVGCAIGAAVAGAIALIADRISERRREVAELKVADGKAEDDDFWRSSSLNLIQAEEEVGEDDPTGDLGRFRTGQITIDFPALADQAVAAAVTGPRHFAASGTRRTESKAPRRTGRHFAPSAAQQAAPAAPARGRHFAHAAKSEAPVPAKVAPAKVEPVATRVPAVAAVTAPAVAAPVSELHGRARLMALPVIESRRTPVRVPHVMSTPQEVAAAAAGQASAVAPKPAQAASPAAPRTASQKPAAADQRLGFTGRLRMQMAARAKGVRAVLAERLGSEALDGVPIIQRADGSVSEVTPTWFDQNVVPALASITGVNPRIEDTTPRMPEPESAPRVETDAPSRAAIISNRVAEVNVGVFPELRTADDLNQGDAFEQALKAMGETIAQNDPRPAFQDVVGGPSTIDDPDGLEGPTGFIPFRVPAAHPEVVDTNTYVDYLLRDEISQNGSVVLSHSPHAHLRVIEGGTGRLHARRRTGDTGPTPSAAANSSGPQGRTGRHFAPPAPYAAEA